MNPNQSQAEGRGRVGSSALFDVLGEDAPARHLTAEKTASILCRDNSRVTGFVVTDPNGNIGIVDKSAVRWLSKAEMWWLMHESESPLSKSSNGKVSERTTPPKRKEP